MNLNRRDGDPRHLAPGWQLQQNRVRDILWVCSLYDSFRVEQKGQLRDLLFREYRRFGVTNCPRIRRVTTAAEALVAVAEEHFDLVITMKRVGDTDARDLGKEVKAARPGLPVVALAINPLTLPRASELVDLPSVDRYFAWTGDPRLFMAIVKHIEDLLNAERDVHVGGTLAALLVESSMFHYSKLLPMLYVELLGHSHRVAKEGRNLTQRSMRRRARPKLLLACGFEEANTLYREYGDHLMGLVAPVAVERDGRLQRGAGVQLVKGLLKADPHLPVFMVCREAGDRQRSESLPVHFADWGRPGFQEELESYFGRDLAFGDFVFRSRDGRELRRAHNLKTLRRAIAEIEDESVEFHAAGNDFSKWLRAHAEFSLAAKLRPRKISEFARINDLREYLLNSLSDYIEEQRRGIVHEFDAEDFEEDIPFVQLSGGSLGAKAQGLASMSSLLAHHQSSERFPGVRIEVPNTAVVGTDSFDQFMEENDLWKFVLRDLTDEAILERFLGSSLPQSLQDTLRIFLDKVRHPLAVRSSSLFEDSMELPLAGVYATYMIPNNEPSLELRVQRVSEGVKRVYASTFFDAARAYLRATPFQPQDEKMAVILQRAVGHSYGVHYYPAISGVARSYNYYPLEDVSPADGVAFLALGLGMWIVEGGESLRFCPKRPALVSHLGSTRELLKNSQREFFALPLARCAENGATGNGGAEPHWDENGNLVRLGLGDALAGGALRHVGSVYSADNDRVYPGVGRPGTPLVTFSQILDSGSIPLPQIIAHLLEIGQRAIGSAVEIEFAVDMDAEGPAGFEFGFLQVRPMVTAGSDDSVSIDDIDRARVICESSRAMGTGAIRDIQDILYVSPRQFDRAKTVDVAQEIDQFNARLLESDRPYVLIGPGRWGSADRWLGIPVRWSQIAGARVIVETQFEDVSTEPSQGTHFFHNLSAFRVGYLTILPGVDRPMDLDWLDAQTVHQRGRYVRHLQFEDPLEVVIEGRSGRGVLLRPG